MKKYFAKYLPVEGKIKDDDYFEEEDITGKKYILKNLGPLSLLPHDHLKSRQKVKLFLCSKDIEVGDIVKEQLLNGKLENFTIHTLNDIDLDKQFKVIGEISSDAIWVKERDEFDKTDFINKKFVKLLSVPESYPLRNADLNAYYDYNKNFVGTTQVYVIDDYCSSPSFEIDDEYLEFITVCCIKCPTCKRFH